MEYMRMLVSDLDGTLVGNEDALARFAEWYAARKDQLRLVYASGRFYESIVELIDSTLLPEPDAVIASVGARIALYPDGKNIDAWPRYLGRWDAEGICNILTSFGKLQPQPDEVQTEFKLSFYADGLETSDLVELRRRLAESGYSAEMVYSSNRDLDVLPAGVHKGSAVAFSGRGVGVET